MSHPFGDSVTQLLHRKHGLSLNKLASGIDQPQSVVSLMCHGQRLTGPQARERVVAIISWLQQQGALITQEEASTLLRAAGMSDLNPARPEEARLLLLLSAPQPAVIAAAAPPAPRLPLLLNSFVGRQRDLAEVQRVLDLPTTRLLTLTGTGGCGKTRLGLQVAAALFDRFAGGVFFVNLAVVSDPALVMSTIAQTLEIREETGQSLQQRFVERLQQPVLLLLDNFEQVVSAAVHVVDLLAACPQLKVLVTSRTVLHVQAEYEFPVPPLALPPLSQLPESEELARYAAIALFLERVRAFKPAFQLTTANARLVAEICVRLDGLPLALELAAARVRLLPLQALLARLSQGLAVLTGGARDLPVRQQTLRNTIKWSYDLLGADEQRIFRWLATFVGGCTLEAVEVLAQGAGTMDLNVFNTLSALLDNSLIQQSEQEAEEPRFLMLQTIREYGLEMLSATGELETNRMAHARYFLALAEQAQAELHGPKQASWLKQLEQEHDNLRAALEWALEDVAGAHATQHRELAWSLSTALWEFWRINGHYREGQAFLERALALSEGEDVSLRARALRAAANLAIWQGDHARAEDLAQRSLALYRELEDAHGMINSLFLLGGIAWRRGKIVESLALYEERVRLMRDIGESWEVGQALYYLADLTSMHGEYVRSQALFAEALLLFRKAGNELWVGGTLVHSAFWLYFSLGDPTIVRQRLYEGQILVSKVGNRHWRSECSWLTALLALSEDELASALRLIRESLAIYREMGSPWFIALTLNILGRVEARRGEITAAHSAYQESLTLCQEQGEQFLLPFNLEGLAALVATQGNLRWAAQLWGTAEALREAIDSPLPPFDRTSYAQAVNAAKEQWEKQAFAAAWQEGRAMTVEQVLAAQGAVAQPMPPLVDPLASPPTKTLPTGPSHLTAREIEVLRMVTQGLTNAQVAEKLVISPRTVNWHLTSIYSKLGVSSRSAATRYAIERRLV